MHIFYGLRVWVGRAPRLGPIILFVPIPTGCVGLLLEPGWYDKWINRLGYQYDFLEFRELVATLEQLNSQAASSSAIKGRQGTS